MYTDLISIILPVYNVKPYLEECINSIINQTYKNIEIIIVDDCSTDGSNLICEKYKELDNRIKVIHDDENHGLSYARNKGLDICSGKYINFIDSDDYVSSDFIEKLYNSIISNEADISVCGSYNLKNDSTTPIGDIRAYNSVYNGKELLKNCSINTAVWNKLYKADIWKELRFDYGKLHEDLFIMYKIMYKCKVVSIVKENLYFHRVREGSISLQLSNFKRARDVIEASENRVNFFRDKEKEYYYMCLIEHIGNIRRAYTSTCVYGDRKLYKKELKVMLGKARSCYIEYLLHNCSSYKSDKKDFFFILFPHIFWRMKKIKKCLSAKKSK